MTFGENVLMCNRSKMMILLNEMESLVKGLSISEIKMLKLPLGIENFCIAVNASIIPKKLV